ncbi:MAG: 3-oxoacyl-[acyl-carrier-protein] reductase [Bernardetiaceae bacterium]
MGKLDNRVAIVTGGSRGIGKATATLFAQEGATVFIWDLLEELGAAAAAEITDAGGKAFFQKVNTTIYEEPQAAVKEILDAHGRVDILVNNAGITRDSSFMKMTAEQWDQVISVNLTGVFNCTKAVVPTMREQKYGRLLTASSVVGLYGNFGQSNYVATKAGVIGMTKVWAKEFGKYGITANCVAPGFIKTEMTEKIPEEYRASAITRIPVGRLGETSDIAHAYLYLASEEAGFVTGTCLSVDGGALGV